MVVEYVEPDPCPPAGLRADFVQALIDFKIARGETVAETGYICNACGKRISVRNRTAHALAAHGGIAVGEVA